MLAFSVNSWIRAIQYNGTWTGVLSLLTKGGTSFFFTFLDAPVSEWSLFFTEVPSFESPWLLAPGCGSS